MKFIILFFLFLFNFQPVFSQQPSYFFLGDKQFEGVQIYDVIQDKDLNYWFATDQGFYRYDNYSFEKIDCHKMKGQSAFGFVMNKNGVIFCYNLNNQIIKIENNSCTVFYELKENERASDIYLAVTKENSLLVITRTALLFDPNGNRVTTPQLPNHYYGFPFLTSKGNVICHISQNDSLLILENSKFKIVPLGNKSLPVNGVLKFFTINNSTYCISALDKKLYLFDENDYSIKLVSENFISQSSEFLRFYNENNQLWVAGTVSGVRVVDNEVQQHLSEMMYPEYVISDIFKDSEGNLLLSTFNHGVIVIPNLEIPDVLSLPKDQSVVSIHHDSDMGMLMGTLRGQLIAFQNNQYKVLSDDGNRPLQSVYSWPGFPYVIFDDGKIKVYNKVTGKISILIEGSLKDATLLDEQNVYLAINIGVCKATLENTGSFKCNYSDALKIRTYSIEIERETNNVYVATSDGLKVLFPNGSTSNVTLKAESIFANDISVSDKMLYVATKNKTILMIKNGEIVSQINPVVNQRKAEISKLIVRDKKIYTLSAEGFVVFDLNGSVIMQLNKVHGFSTNKIFDFEIVGDQLWINHSKGVQKLHIDQLNNKIEKPLIHFSNISVNDKSVKDFTNVIYHSDQRKFRFKVSSPTLINKESIRYYFKLVGYDDKWQIVNYMNNEFVYNALGSGSYMFIIKAENQGVFSEPISYSFTIEKPFYFRWWFILLAVTLFLGVVFLVYRWQINIQRKKSKQINELNASKLTAIQSQMNPHFIFNSLNSIQDLVLKGDVDKSYTFITKFSNLIRRTLNYSDKDFIEFEQEIKLIELYLSLEKLRFKENLNYSIDADAIDDITVPPMLIQPFIENALIHGLLHKEGLKQITIKFELNDVLKCIIEDNGVGREKAKEIKLRQKADHESFSSQAIKKRFSILSNHFNGELGFKYDDLYSNGEACGTRVTLFIPFKHKF